MHDIPSHLSPTPATGTGAPAISKSVRSAGHGPLKRPRISPTTITLEISKVPTIAASESTTSARAGAASLIFPAWMGSDPATEGPNYLGYTALLLPLSLLVELAVLAIIMMM